MKRMPVRLLIVCLPLLLGACATPSTDDLPKLDARFRSAHERGAESDAVKLLTLIATRFPEALPRYSDDIIERLADPQPGWPAAAKKERLGLLQELFTQHWKGQFGVEPSRLWLILVTLLVESGRVNEAVNVVPHIQAAREMILLKVDRRFEPLMRSGAPLASVESVARVDVEAWRAATLRFPRSLEASVELSRALLAAGEYEQALAEADSSIAKVVAAKSARDLYDDADDELAWLYDTRANALAALGRWSDAEVELRRAVDLPERRRRNISNTLNLAAFHLRTGQADDAVTTLGSFAHGDTKGLSRYGVMMVKDVLFEAAFLKNDEASMREALDYLSKYRADDPSIYQFALLWTNRRDEWARYMIERLHDPASRGEALRDLQIYQEAPPHPSEFAMRKRLREFANQAQVQAAVAEVGVIERFSIPPP